MAEALYLQDCYLKEFDAIVQSVKDDKYIVLDRTAFYPNGGGQPHDTGTLTTQDGQKYTVMFTGKFGGEISHEVDRSGLKTGDKVHGIIDWERRYTHMRYHTASHVVDGVIEQATGAQVTGNQIGMDKTRVDFNMEGQTPEQMKAHEDKMNETISAGYDVSIKILPKPEALKIPKIFKLQKAFNESIQQIRIINIQGFDTQACGGTHVKNTKEIGGVEIIKIDNRGKNNRRIYFKLK